MKVDSVRPIRAAFLGLTVLHIGATKPIHAAPNCLISFRPWADLVGAVLYALMDSHSYFPSPVTPLYLGLAVTHGNGSDPDGESQEVIHRRESRSDLLEADSKPVWYQPSGGWGVGGILSVPGDV